MYPPDAHQESLEMQSVRKGEIAGFVVPIPGFVVSIPEFVDVEPASGKTISRSQQQSLTVPT